MRTLACILDYASFTVFGISLASLLLFSIVMFVRVINVGIPLTNPALLILALPAWFILALAALGTFTVFRSWSRDLAERYT